MFEAVDWRDHDDFFGVCSRLLDPHGRMALQTIVIEEGAFDRTKVHRDFIKRFIFPGGCLPSVTSLVSSAARHELQLVELHDIGRHYPETLRRWRSSLDTRPRTSERAWSRRRLPTAVDVLPLLLRSGIHRGPSERCPGPPRTVTIMSDCPNARIRSIATNAAPTVETRPFVRTQADRVGAIS